MPGKTCAPIPDIPESKTSLYPQRDELSKPVIHGLTDSEKFKLPGVMHAGNGNHNSE